jgi:hypothetical protein
MTDIEMTKLCADAMGITVVFAAGRWYINSYWEDCYGPLDLDDQAMELLKRFKLHSFTNMDGDREIWVCLNDTNNSHFGNAPDLNRAIVECVAKMQACK